MTIDWRAAACVLGVLQLAVPTPALACTGPSCLDGKPFPRSAASLPANLPGFPFSAGLPTNRFSDDAGPDAPSPELRLRNASGTLVPMTSRAMSRRDDTETLQQFSRFYVPDGALTPGAYTLEYDRAFGCSQADAGALTIPLTVTAAVALPTSLGTLSAVPLPRGLVDVDSGGECQRSLEAARVRLELAATPEYEAFRSLAFVEVTVDGAPWRGVARGPGDTMGQTQSFDPTVLFALCNASRTAEIDRLGEGRHVASLRAHIEGAETDPPPVTVAFDLACSDVPDASIDSTPPGATSDAGASAPRAMRDDASGSGCVVSHAGRRRSLRSLARQLAALLPTPRCPALTRGPP